MTQKINWDDYEVVETEDFAPEEIWEAIEEVREIMDRHVEEGEDIPVPLEDLYTQLVNLEEE